MARDGANDKPPSPRVSVVVVAYESGPLLGDCLSALRAQTTRDLEIILIDNASRDGAAEAAARGAPDVTFIANAENLGFAAAVNQGARLARGRWLALLNPDAFPQANWLEALLAAAATYPEVQCFASRQLMAEDPGRLDGLGDVMSAAGFGFRGGYGQPDPGLAGPAWVFSACGGAMMIDRELFLGMGGFDERLFCYCEDVDLGYRLQLQGRRTLLVPAAVVRHVGSASSGGPRSDFATFHGTRNRLWIYLKNTPPLLLWLTLPLHLLATAVLFSRHHARGELAAPWRGFVAALKGLPLALQARRESQRQRRVGSWGLARELAWDPRALLRRAVVVKPARAAPTR
ncbi:glycosyltransferase family 2 protein [Phenylobacterium sp. LjRoot219]|uniref:glycosyltransferase family 2 protein n=1 Tax=Phenylobacterium sp. LjRoot219 TaxID=3342283 RepID=UPI003ED12CFA